MNVDTKETIQVTKNGGFYMQPGKNGKYLYYTKHQESGIWRMPVEGGEEELLIPGTHTSRWGNWAISSKGIYFVNNNVMIAYYDFLSQSVIADITNGIRTPIIDNSSFTISSDEKWLLFSQVDGGEMDLVMVNDYKYYFR